MAGFLCRWLNAWSPRENPPDELMERLQDSLYAGLHRLLGDPMLYLSGTRWRRVTTTDLANMADDLMGLLFCSLHESAELYSLVRDWAFRSGSLAALSALSQRFDRYQTRNEQDLYRSIYCQRRQTERTTD